MILGLAVIMENGAGSAILRVDVMIKSVDISFFNSHVHKMNQLSLHLTATTSTPRQVRDFAH
jgi:hypothetical protein